jgi:hypothetical protein
MGFGRCRVVERPWVGDRSLTSLSPELMLRLDDLRPGGVLRWKAEDHRLGKSRSEMWKAGTSKVVPPLPVSVKDRWVGPREQVLNVPIACRRYVPDKPSSRSSIESWLYPHYFNGCLGREAEYESMDRSAVVLWIGSWALFLGSSGPAQLCWWLCESLLCVDRVRYV